MDNTKSFSSQTYPDRLLAFEEKSFHLTRRPFAVIQSLRDVRHRRHGARVSRRVLLADRNGGPMEIPSSMCPELEASAASCPLPWDVVQRGGGHSALSEKHSRRMGTTRACLVWTNSMHGIARETARARTRTPLPRPRLATPGADPFPPLLPKGQGEGGGGVSPESRGPTVPRTCHGCGMGR